MTTADCEKNRKFVYDNLIETREVLDHHSHSATAPHSAASSSHICAVQILKFKIWNSRFFTFDTYQPKGCRKQNQWIDYR